MKFHWGTGIALFYGVFVSVLLYFVIKSTQQDNSLVSDDYYAEDLKYQEHYDKLRNAASLEQDLEIRENGALSQLEFLFPPALGKAEGEIHFFCPSDSRSDFKVPIEAHGQPVQTVSFKDLKKGYWKIKVDWQAGGTRFFQETAFVF